MDGRLLRKFKNFPMFRPQDQLERLKGYKQRPHPIVRRVDHSKVARYGLEAKERNPKLKQVGVKRPHQITPIFDPEIHHKLPEEREIRVLKDGRTIFCWHPDTNIPFEFSRPMFDEDPAWKDYRESITQEEADIMRKMREKEPSKFTEEALVRIFEVKPFVVQQLAPPPQQYVEDMQRRMDGINMLKESAKKTHMKILEKELKDAAEVGVREGQVILKEKGLR